MHQEEKKDEKGKYESKGTRQIQEKVNNAVVQEVLRGFSCAKRGGNRCALQMEQAVQANPACVFSE